MQTHPVPQNIAQYEFNLVGDMTLKQFMFLAVGALLGLAVWKLPIPFAIIRGALAIVPAGAGVLAAFVPINGRPFAQWVSAFFKAIYAPTIFEYQSPVQAKIIVDPTVKNQVPKTPALSFTSALTQAVSPKPKVEESVAPPIIIPEATKPVEITKPDLAPKETTTGTFVAPPPPPAPNVVLNIPKNEMGLPTEDSLYVPTEKPTAIPRFTPIDTAAEVKVVTTPSIVTHTPSPTTPSASLTSTIAPPSSPNILTGLVVDPSQLSLAGATIEIIDSKTGIPTRALRTNRLGQFQIAIPLPLGNYTLQVEKEGYKFSPVSITVNNSIIKPVILSAVSSEVSAREDTTILPINQVTKF